jgi:hypothetical protein
VRLIKRDANKVLQILKKSKRDTNISMCFFYHRSKLVFVNFCFRVAYGVETDEYNKRLECVCSSLGKCYEEYESITFDHTTSGGSSQVEGKTVRKRKLEMIFSQFQSQNCHLWPKRSKLDNYLEEALVESDEENFDVLQWWKRNSDLYPTLAKMARDF